MSVTTSVSTAMLPVVTAATSAAAMTALGISPAMQPVVGAATLSGARAAFGGPEINISWFGAALDNVTDDSAAWKAAIADGRPIFHPGGTSVVTGNLALADTTTIRGVSSFRATPGQPITQTSMVRFVGNNAGVTVQHSTGGGFTLEKIGFEGDAVRYTGQIGLLLSDALRPSGLNEGWPTLRDVLFNGFAIGCLVGNTYQTGYMHNVFFQNSAQIGYQNKSTDWYHHGVYGGNGSNVASIAQLILGSTGGVMTYSAGYHQFHGGAWFGGNNTVIIANTSGNKFVGCDIQNGNQNGVLLSGAYANDNRFTSCYFSGNNALGGSRNVNGQSFFDVYIGNGCRANTFIGNRFADAGVVGRCVAAGIFLAPNTDITLIQGNTFNMDLIVSPGFPGAPQAVMLDPSVQAFSLDHNLIEGNLASYGEQGVLTFNQLPVNMASVAQPYKVASVLSISAGAAVLASSAAIGCILGNPGFAGRLISITSETPGKGNTVTCTTAGALGGSHHSILFTAAGAYIQLISISATAWQILNSANVIIS
jgi:hypothetical protein